MPKPQWRTGPPKASELCAMLADVREPKLNETVKASTVMAVAAELWGGPCDWDGRNVFDVRSALGLLDEKFGCSPAMSTAVALTEYHLGGCKWSWTLRSLDPGEMPPYGYFANITKKSKGSRIYTPHYAVRASYALIMSLLVAVETERALQLEERRGKKSD